MFSKKNVVSALKFHFISLYVVMFVVLIFWSYSIQDISIEIEGDMISRRTQSARDRENASLLRKSLSKDKLHNIFILFFILNINRKPTVIKYRINLFLTYKVNAKNDKKSLSAIIYVIFMHRF